MSGPPSGGGTDPSMEDILASIRRILNEDDAGPPPPREAAPERRLPPPSDVFALDASMMVPEPALPPPAARAEPAVELIEPQPEPSEPQKPEIEMPPVAAAPIPLPAPVAVAEARDPVPPSWPASLVAPEAAAAAALSVGSLRRTLEAGRAPLAVRSGGPTLDDMVREELRPVLKAWLDANLAPIVERLVRAEIERVVGRADL